MKKFLSILTVLLFVFATGGSFVSAAGLSDIIYGPSGSTVGTYVPANSILAMFTNTNAISAGETIVLDVPNNTILASANIHENDFTIQELGTGSAPTTPTTVVADLNNHTLTFTVAAGSLSSDTAGIGTFVIKMSNTASGNEIRNPQVATNSGILAVTTQAGDSGSINTVSFPYDVAAKLSFNTQPSSPVVAGAAIGTQPIVRILDQYDNVITGDSASVITITSFSNNTCTNARAGLTGTTTETAASGVANFAGNNLASTLAGANLYLKATSGSLTSACSTAVTVNPAAAHHLHFSTTPATTSYMYVPFATQPTVVVRDQYNNVTADTDVVTLLVDPTDNTCAAAVTTNLGGTRTAAAGTAYTNLQYNAVDTSGVYLCAAANVAPTGAIAGVSSRINVYSHSGQTVTTSGTTATTVPQTTTTTAPAQTTTTTPAPAVTSIPQPAKPIAQMTQTEKNSYVMELQTFLIQLLTQLLNLMKK